MMWLLNKTWQSHGQHLAVVHTRARIDCWGPKANTSAVIICVCAARYSEIQQHSMSSPSLVSGWCCGSRRMHSCSVLNLTWTALADDQPSIRSATSVRFLVSLLHAFSTCVEMCVCVFPCLFLVVKRVTRATNRTGNRILSPALRSIFAIFATIDETCTVAP